LAITVTVSFFVFRMTVLRIAEASLEGTMLAIFPIIWVILSAFFVYKVTVQSGGINTIRQMLLGISEDRRIQALILAFAFGGFLEAVAGFGTSVAIPAGIMVAMGFRPIRAATICLIANTIPVAFGVLGVPIVTLAQVTSLPLDRLSIYTAVQLLPFVVLLPCVLVCLVTGT
jgi:lactate permease